MNNTILIVDDEEDIRDLVSDILSDQGYTCFTAANSSEAFKVIEKNKPTVVLLDIWLQGSDLDGLGILENVRESHPSIPVIMISGHGTIETAVSAIKLGAYNYIEKPFSPDKLNIMVKRALESAKLKRENLELKKKSSNKTELVGKSAAVIQLKSNIEKIAPTSSRVLIKGEYGSEKGLIAKLIHKASPRKNYPFVTINPFIASNEKIKNDLLGDPSQNKFGIAEISANGTLFIDNIAELPKEIQLNLLKFIQGSKDSQSANKYNVRIVASAGTRVNEDVKSGKLLKELLFRVNVVNLEAPSLKNRKEDIEDIVKSFMKNLAKHEGFSPKTIGDDVLALFQSQSWPGNIRELRNNVEKLVMLANIECRQDISAELLNKNSDTNNTSKNTGNNQSDTDYMSLPLRQAREEFERQYLSAQMTRFNNNISKTSIFVGMERSALHRKLKMLDIHSNSPKESQED